MISESYQPRILSSFLEQHIHDPDDPDDPDDPQQNPVRAQIQKERLYYEELSRWARAQAELDFDPSFGRVPTGSSTEDQARQYLEEALGDWRRRTGF